MFLKWVVQKSKNALMRCCQLNHMHFWLFYNFFNFWRKIRFFSFYQTYLIKKGDRTNGKWRFMIKRDGIQFSFKKYPARWISVAAQNSCERTLPTLKIFFIFSLPGTFHLSCLLFIFVWNEMEMETERRLRRRKKKNQENHFFEFTFLFKKW